MSAAKFNTYRFADYKEKVIDLLKRVTTVSVGTLSIVTKMTTALHKGLCHHDDQV